MDRYPHQNGGAFTTRLAAGAMARSANGNPDEPRYRQERDSYLSNAREAR